MSDDVTTPPPADAPKPQKRAKKRRTWKQRIKLTLLILIVGGLLIRFGFNILLPTVVRKAANAFDLDCTYDRMTMSVFGGNAHIWNLVLRPKSGGESIVKVDYLQGNISAANLLRGRLVVWRAEVDGVNMLIDREPDGTIPLLKRFATAPAPVHAAPAEKPADPGQPRQANLQAPLRIDSVRVTHVIARFRDRSVTPTFETTVRTNLRLTDVGKADVPAKFELEVDANPVLDTLAVYGEMRNTPTSVDADLSFLMRGLHAKPAEPYLLPLGLKPIANDITVRATGKFKANVIPNTPDISAQLVMSDISASADTAEWASLKSLTVDVKKLNASNVEVGKVQIQSARASAKRSETGGLQVAGFELVPVAAAVTAPPPATKPAAPTAASPSAFKASLDELAMADLEAAFDDTAVRPAARLAARLESMSVKNIVFDPAKPDAAVDISGTASLPNAVTSITWSGTVTPFAAKRQVAMKLRADGINPKVAEPYLAPLGVTPDFENGTFTADLSASASAEADGTQNASATLSNIKLADRGVTLLEMPSAALTGLKMTPDGVVQVGAIDVTGPAIIGRRDEDGSVMTLGLRYRPTTQPTAAPTPVAKVTPAPSPTTKPSEPATAIVLPKMKIDHIAWKDIQVRFEDRQKDGKGAVIQSTASIEAAGLSTVGSTTKPSAPGTFKATLQAPGIAEQLTADGSLSASANGMSLRSDFSGKGITGKTIENYLKPLGIVVTLKDGQLTGKADINLRSIDDGLQANVQLAGLSYADGEQELAGADGVKVGPVDLTSKGITIETIEVSKPRARVTRHADGLLEAGGVKLVPLPPPPPQPAPATPAPPQPLKLSPSPIALMLKQLKITEGALMLTDRVPAKPLETAVRGGVELVGVSLATGAAPAKLTVNGSVDGIVGSATVIGDVSAAPDSPAARLKITADKINAQSIAPYLPPGMVSTLTDGHFRMSLDAAAANHPAGGVAAHLSVSDLLLEDRATKVTWATVGGAQVRIARFDPAGLTIDIPEITTSGITLDVQKNDNGTIEAAGVKIGVAPPPPREPAPAAVAATLPATQPTVVATTQPAVDLAALVADARRPLPLVTVGKLDLKLDKLRVRGLAGPDGKPLELTAVRMHNTGPMQLGGENAETRPPLKLQIDGAIDPVVGKFYVGLDATPLAAEPAMTIDVKATGINGQGLVDLMPTLATTIEGKNLTDGQFITQLKASLNYGRRGPRDLDLGRGFTLMFTVAPLHFRAQPDGEILAGVEEIRGEGIKIEPKNGNVTLKSIEVTKPIGRIVRDKEGIHALGLVIPIRESAPTTQPAEVATTQPAETPVVAAQPPIARPASEIRLDRFAVSGIDLIVEDRTSTPVTVVPLKTFDLEVRDLSNQMPWTGKPMRFDLLCTADKVPLPPRKGAERGVGSTTQTEEGTGEMRELFSQVTANGRISLLRLADGRTVPSGWAKTSVNGFELLGVRGLAAPYKVVIGGGVFDDSNDIRFLEDGSIETQNRVVLTNLSLSEPADGPIRTALNLPAPIDIAIKAVSDADGSITMKLPVTVESGKVDTAGVVGSAIGAVSKVLVTAILDFHKKAAAAIANVLTGGPEAKTPEPPVELTFVNGSALLTADAVRQLTELAQRMAKEDELELQLRHVLSSEDVASLSRRANPEPGDVRLLTEQLRRDKTELLARRAALADEAKIQFASQADAASVTVAALRTTDRQLAQLDASLDQLFELLRPGAANQADRRTRAACLALAKDRFDVIQRTLSDAGVPGVTSRVRRTNPQFDVKDDPTGAVVVTLVPKKE